MFDFMAKIADVIGMIGVVSTLIGYYLLNINKLASTSMVYLLLNFFGSCLILFSLAFHMNISAASIEIAWVLISLIGIYRVTFRRS